MIGDGLDGGFINEDGWLQPQQPAWMAGRSSWAAGPPLTPTRLNIATPGVGWTKRLFTYTTFHKSAEGDEYKTVNGFCLIHNGSMSFRRCQWHPSNGRDDPTPFHGEWSEDSKKGCLTCHFTATGWPEPTVLKTINLTMVGLPSNQGHRGSPCYYEGRDSAGRTIILEPDGTYQLRCAHQEEYPGGVISPMVCYWELLVPMTRPSAAGSTEDQSEVEEVG